MKFKRLLLFLFASISGFADLQFEKVKDLPEELKSQNLLLPLNGSVRLLKTIDLSGLKLIQSSKEQFEVSFDGAAPIYEQGMPILVSFMSQAPLWEGYETELLLEPELVEASVGPVSFETTPSPLLWEGAPLFAPSKREGFYPGAFIRTSSDLKGRLIAKIYPVQYNLKTGKTFVLRKLSLWIKYKPKPSSLILTRFAPVRSLIVTTRSLERAAEKLARFHLEKNFLESQILYVEDLENEPMISEEILPDGYKNGLDRDEIVSPFDSKTKRGYHYELSKKLIYYLQKRILSDVSPLRYVTLLGTADQVPPSYYFSLPAVFGKVWGVTDQCYSSAARCLEPRLALGRLPFETNEEFDAYLTKAESYVQTKEVPKKELALAAGKGFPTGKAFPNSAVYVGELGALRTIQDPLTDWVGVKKIFRTKFNYNRKTLLSIFSGQGDTRFIYALDHGKGNQWMVEHGFISSKEIEEAPIPSVPNNPVIVSIACSNAAFDETLTKELIFENVEYGSISVGKALLRAKGGAIAYWGVSRPVMGNPIYSIDLKGNLDLKGSTYGFQLLEGFFEKYRVRRQGRLGDLILEAQRAFAIERGNHMEEKNNTWTYLITTLLGDPTLVLPDRPELKTDNWPLAESKTVFEKGVEDLPLFRFDKSVNVRLEFLTSKPVDATLFQLLDGLGAFMSEKIVEEKKGVVGAQFLSHEFVPEDSYGTYFLRLENTEGVPRERQVWFTAQP